MLLYFTFYGFRIQPQRAHNVYTASAAHIQRTMVNGDQIVTSVVKDGYDNGQNENYDYFGHQ